MQKKSIIFFIFKILKIPLSITTLSITAKYFGVSIYRDIWLIALAGITMIELAVWGPINETFRAKFIMTKEIDGEIIALSNTRSLIFYIFIFSFFLMIFLELFPSIPARFFAPGFNIYEQKKLQVMIQFLAPLLLINQFNFISTSILNAYDVFYTPEISSLITQSLNILLIYFLAGSAGIYSLAISLYLSSIIFFLLLIIELKKKEIIIYPKKIPNFIGFKYFSFYAIPFFIPYFLGQISSFTEKALSSKLEKGSISILDFSKKIPDMFNMIIVTVILTMLVPVLTKSFVKNDKKNFEKDFLQTYKLGLLGIIFFCSMFTSSAGEVVIKILYASKEISESNMNQIIYLGKFYIICLLAVYSYMIFGMCLLSINKSKLYAFWGAIAQILVISMNIFLIDFFGIKIFPISFFISHYISALFMFYSYPYDKSKIIIITMKYYMFGFISIMLSYYSVQCLIFDNSDTIYGKLIFLSFSFIIVLIIFYIFGSLFKLSEIKSFNKYLVKLYNKYLVK